jgi:hypothetical protein
VAAYLKQPLPLSGWAYAIVADDVAQQDTRGDSEDALFWIKLPLALVGSHEGALEVVDQGMSLPGFHDYIIDVGFDQVILDLISKAVLDSMLVRGPRVLKHERHSRVAVGAKRCNKGRLNLIVLVESNLVITRVAIKEGQQLAAGCGINDFVYAG